MSLVVNNLFFIYWLIINFSRRSLIIFSNYFFIVLNRSNNIRMINNFSITLLNIQGFLNSFDLWLLISLSYSSSSWNCNRNLSIDNLILSLCWLSDLFGINWFRNFDLIDNRCLNNLLFDNWLGHYSSSNDWLRNYLLFDNWLRSLFYCLTYSWS